MKYDLEYLKEIFSHPGEALSVELKRWFDPASEEGIAKIVKSCIAMRNNNGGLVIVGMRDDGKLDSENEPPLIEERFHQDAIQGMVARYASNAFEVKVILHQHQERRFPVIFIDEGIKYPVASKRELRKKQNNDLLIEKDAVYVRSLNSNNTPSTTRATYQDWENIVNTCFDNREADIGRFFRRHLSGLQKDAIFGLVSEFSQGNQTRIPRERQKLDDLAGFCDHCSKRFKEACEKRKIPLSQIGTWEVGFSIDGEMPPQKADGNFLNLVLSANPRYTGWPIWVDSRGFKDRDENPYYYKEGWETITAHLQDSDWGFSKHLDFWRVEPAGKFYNVRGIDDDLASKSRQIPPLKFLEIGVVIWRVSEAIAVSFAIARAMKCKIEGTKLFYVFRWHKLENRQLSSWAKPFQFPFVNGLSRQDEVTVELEIPLDIPNTSLYQYVHKVITDLAVIFDGTVMNAEVIERLTAEMLSRR